ncbi:SAM-dependent chlorinase/fluorinase [bacterium]|nr:SAM-dependent chlorinase/fluorinase [bacterium]
MIVLLTDFGEKDFYVGAVKGVIYKIFPEAKIDSISHSVSKFNVKEAAFTLLNASKEFPEHTVFLVVVDPEVGTSRNPIVVTTKNNFTFVAPDNGVLTLVLQEFGAKKIYKIIQNDPNISKTFHGRDVFAPAAALWEKGERNFLQEISEVFLFENEKVKTLGNIVFGEILSIDDFGNCVTNIPKNALKEAGFGDKISVKIGKKEFALAFLETYGNAKRNGFLALFSSTNFLEFAVNCGNFAKKNKVETGMKVEVNCVF